MSRISTNAHMDISEELIHDAIVLQAGFNQLRNNFTTQLQVIQSRGIYFCKTGKGSIEFENGESFELNVNDCVVLPWGRRQRVKSDAEDPIMLATIHIVPYHSRETPITYWVGHKEDDQFWQRPGLEDRPWPGFDKPQKIHLLPDDPLAQLIDYIVKWHVRGNRIEAQSRAIARVFIRELHSFLSQEREQEEVYPIELKQIVRHVKRRFDFLPLEAIAVQDLATLISRSSTHLERVFRKHIGQTPKRWLILLRISKAKELLASTGASIGEVGHLVGIDDPYYFSKLFKKITGENPSEYRRKHQII